ncbi:ESX-1 secretion-associated EspB domain protein [Mycobacterium kansasii 824]|nr:ESX-1 secretion-associated EspB domain protein [Mycobacterium kansasii 824]
MLSAENMRTYLAAGATERQRLAQFMRNVANAYDDVDQESATALNYGGQGCLLPAMLTANANPGRQH